jgi:HD-like signal output (HDOD) protein
MTEKLLNEEDDVKKAEELISSIGIPSQPSLLLEINKRISGADTGIGDLADLISRDVAMSAKLLKIANSAFFGLREKVDSIQRALSLIGLKNFNRIILATSLRESICGHGGSMEKFWNHSMTVAGASAHIAGRVGFESEEQAYIAGLFHDCGVSMLMKKYPDYHQILDYALGVANSASLSGAQKSIIGIEEERFNTHHCAVGYLITRTWHLPACIVKSVWHHHYVNIDIHTDPVTRRLSAILLLADYIGGHILYLMGSRCAVESEADWAGMHKKAATELAINAESIKDMKDDLVEKLYG